LRLLAVEHCNRVAVGDAYHTALDDPGISRLGCARAEDRRDDDKEGSRYEPAASHDVGRLLQPMPV
jgi:hypothetical protein